MGTNVIQTAFHAGEWAPALAARVDVAKYHSACALAKNFYVDYRGGLSSRMGTKYILQAYKSSSAVRLIPFQASFTVGYILEFGDNYIRFYYNGSPVLETAKTITAISKANPGQVSVASHGWSVGDWVYLTDIGGMTQLNGRYCRVGTTPTSGTFTLQDLNGNNLDTSAFSTYTSGGTAARVYTLPSPYLAADLHDLKFAQNVDKMYFVHTSYSPYVLTIISAANWTITAISFGSTILPPTGQAVATTLGAGTINYSYLITAVDVKGQESGPSAAAVLASKTDLRTVAGSNRITWAASPGAVSYNVYKAILVYTNAVPAGAAHGYIGNCTATTFDDTNILADYSLTPPIPTNPFVGAGVASVTMSAAGTYTTVPTVSFAAPPAGQTTTGSAVLQVQGTPTTGASGTGWVVGDLCYLMNASLTNIVAIVVVATVNGSGQILTFQPITYAGSYAGNVSAGTTPTVFTAFKTPPSSGATASVTVSWGVGFVTITVNGTGYLTAPAVTFSSGAAAGTAVLGLASSGNPSVVSMYDQRLALAGPSSSPQQFNFSKPGAFYNFDVSNPAQPDDGISGTLVSPQLNEIQAMIPMPSGLIVLSNRAAWQIYGSTAGTAVSATQITAQSQAYNGANEVPPIVANQDILYVQAKGSIVRDLSYNFYTNIYTGTDITILSSHLFFKHQILEWAWAEEPFKVVWAIRNDGVMLSLTFVKEQELIGWTHHVTDGLFKSVATITETVTDGSIDAIYLVVERTINGNTVKYIERMAERFFDDYTDCWCVDAGLQYSGSATDSFQGAEHLIGETIVGLADGIPFSTVVSATGTFTLAAPASLVTAGLQFTPDFQSLAIDTGNPTIQAKMKKITGPTIRVMDTLGLQVGQELTTDSLVDIADLVLGNIGTMTNEVVAGLVTGDVRQNIDPDWTEQGQFCLRQPLPYPVSILGIIPELTVGDTEK